MARTLDEDELIEHWLLIGKEPDLLTGRTGPSKLALALWLKFFAQHGRFPEGRSELPDEAVTFVAGQVKVPAAELGLFDWEGRTAERHRAQVRTFLDFGECTVADAERLTHWLATYVCDRERRAERVREALLAQLREERLERPTRLRISQMVGSALSRSETALTTKIASRIPAETIERMLTLIARRTASPDKEPDGKAASQGAAAAAMTEAGGGQAAEDTDEAAQPELAQEDEDELEGADIFAAIREEPGNVSVKSIEREAFKLGAIRAIELPQDLFADIAPAVLLAWRSRVAAEAPSHLREHPDAIKVTLLAAYLHCRQWEIIDALVDLLITTVHRINARADTVVTKEFINELKRVSGKENILFKMAEAALEAPEETVSDVIYPAVPGGIDTLTALLHEYTHKGSTYRRHRQRVFKASYTNHYRTGLIQILEALEFGSTNTVHAPMMTALTLIKRYKAEATNRTKYYATGEMVPVDRIVPAEPAELMFRTDKRGHQRILRSVYECGVFQTLREQLRCKDIWVHGAHKWRNPDLDLPADFEHKRAENYAKLRKPLDAARFTADLIEEMDAELSALHDALPGLDWLQIAERKKGGAIQLTPLEPLPEPRNLGCR
ncbi:DUF4158 domain-containing protein [Streptosporangium canum]|uniref:DUF4158 domain-containing protein n=1 Tax=Streptosporangium canum TaxID=324952 RepID=UPI00369908C9